ncbi:NAD(P)/FAD-dependent oxidoreductase [Candidatus Acidulodesulfobacterium sp. H_13]|uniref:NAD(P)/FAD-dependent oxidoreductase n=1 Tax=Candidatus Acidulodesulfobacterium sp. H_13 TaxID=3395470 RepID=UPI003AF5CA5E
MSKRVIIVGGGVGGTIIANLLAKKMRPEIRKGELIIDVISDKAEHFYQPGLLYMLFGLKQYEELVRDERGLLDPMVELHLNPAVGINKDKNEVSLKNGVVMKYDILVIATGSKPAPEMIPGLKEGGHWFYELDACLKLRNELMNFKGGKIVLTIGMPHKCPVAPLEVTYMLDDWFRQRGIRDKVDYTYTYPIAKLHGIDSVAQFASKTFPKRGIKSEIFFNMKEVDPNKKTVTSIEGTTLKYDLLISVPPHKGAGVIEDSGLGQGGFIPTDKFTLKMKDSKNIYVVGDTTNLPISKAGSTAHFESDVIVENIASELRDGLTPFRYDGKVFCFIETGLTKATYVMFNYETPPNPVAPSALIHWLKLTYNKVYWLTPMGIL